MCDSGRGQVLAPWPNRLGDGTLHLRRARGSGRARRARPTQRHPRPRALDGVAAGVAGPERRSTLGCTLHPQPGYPWRLSLVVEYRLGRDGLDAWRPRPPTLDRTPAPFGIGFHPYLTLVDADRRDLARHPGPAPARHRRAGAAHRRPSPSPAPSSTSPRRRWIGDTVLDTAFTDLRARPRRHGPRRARRHRRRAGRHGVDGRALSATSWCSPATPSSRAAGAAARSRWSP